MVQLADDTSVTVRVQLNNNSGSYRLVMDAQNDAQAWVAGQYLAVSDDWQMVEVEWQTASAAGAGDGYVKLWINDVLVDTLSGLDNDTRHVTKASIGAVAGLDAGTAGTVYWDGFEARRGSHIGPLSFGPASKALAAPLRVSLAASFVYDGDGRRVAQTINGETTYFVGNYYEQTGSTITKYYYAGSQRVAMRVGNTAYYLLTDHLGSTSLTTDSSGNVISELRYTAWGSVKYQAGSSPSDYTFTGQYGYDFGLMYFNARWLDVDTAHFAQADSLIPGAGQSQAWDRYAYSLNNPLLYIDPTGHDPVLGFLTGFLKELARTNFWWHPGYQKDLVIQKNESTSELTGRLVADVASMVIGVIEVGGGTGAAGGGIAVCATGIGCPGGFLAIAGGGALIAEGAGTALNAAYGGGTILAMLSHVISNQSEDQSSDPMGNFRVSSEFEKRMKDWGLSDKEILNVLKNGKKFTDPQGQFLLWDPKSKLAIVVDKIDGELVTVYEQPKLPRTWKTGWLEEFGE